MQKRLFQVAKELKVSISTIQDFLTRNNIEERLPNSLISQEMYTLLKTQFGRSITRFGTIKFYNATKNYGFVIDPFITNPLENREYYFTINSDCAPTVKASDQDPTYLPPLNADDAVSFNLIQVRHKGQVLYNAVHVAALSTLYVSELNALVSLITSKFSQDTLRKFRHLNIHKAIRLLEIWLIRSTRSIHSESDYVNVQLLLKYYKLNLSVNGLEYQDEGRDRLSSICLLAPTTYRCRLWIADWISMPLPDHAILEYIQQGLTLEQCLDKLSNEQAARIYQQYLQESSDLDYIQLLNIWKKRFGYHYDENIETELWNNIKKAYTDEQLYRLALNRDSILATAISKDYFLAGEFSLSDLDKICDKINLSNEEKIEVVCKTKGLAQEKIKFLKKHNLFSDIEPNQLLLKLSVTDIEKLNLWKAGIIDRPYTMEEIYDIVASCDNPTYHIDSLKGIITDTEYNKICFHYIQNSDFRTRDDWEWSRSHLQNRMADPTFSRDLQLNIVVIISLEQWVKSDSCQGYNPDFCHFFHLLSDSDQADFLRKIIELYRIKELKITERFLLNLIEHKRDVNLAVYIVIKTLCKLKREKRFLSQRELYDIIHEIFPDCMNEHKIFSLSHGTNLFDLCKGRITTFENKRPSDDIEDFDITVNMEQQTAVIKLPYKKHEGYADRTLKDNIRNIKYNSNDYTWETPDMAYEDVRSFVSQILKDTNLNLRLQLLKRGTSYDYYFFKQKTERIMLFAEWKPWMNPSHERIKWYKEFCDCNIRWCFGAMCLNNCIVHHPQGAFRQYTLYDFITILKLYTDTGKEMEVEIAKYYSSLNWLNRAVEHLFCRKCKKIAEPNVDRIYHNAYLLTYFHCNNKECEEYKKDFYINRCFRASCLGIIDDRDSKRCPNGRVICPKCGVCCSDQQYKNKRQVGPTTSKLWHFEQHMLFCPYCGKQLEKDSLKNVYCPEHPDYKFNPRMRYKEW